MSIQLVSRRGPIGKGWHAVALREAAERLLGAGRASRGRADARAGRVQWLEVEAGAARAEVEDPDGSLHQARFELPAYREGDRADFLRVARAHPELPALLAGGEYPQRIEAELAPSEVSLLPRSASELSHDCSCLDWPGPCRHVSALVYVLVEAVDTHPVHLLTMRGLTLEDLVAPPAPPSAAVGDVPGAGSTDGTSPGDGPGGPDGGSADGDASADESSDGESPTEGAAPSGAPGPAPYDPRHTDPARLADAVGEDIARIIADFYHQGRN